jgi:diketogulonate reductase-like aldo/keto reductase
MIEGDGSAAAAKRAIETLRMGLDLGLAHIDTAEMYGNGRAEELVANAIKGQRDSVFLVSKVLPSNASYEGTLRACHQSLKRLGTDFLDLYLLHWPSGDHPIKETMRAMEKLVSEGLIRFIGVSNFNVRELKAAQQALSEQRIACNQVLYHLGYRAIESNLLPYCTRERIAVVGYSPFGHGTFLPPSNNNKAKGRGGVLEEIGRRHGHTIRQVTLNFLTRHPNLFTIPKTSDPENVKENSGGMGWDLTEEDVAAIDRAFPAPDTNNNDDDDDGDAPLEMI